jgi:hypothetical protein
MKIRHIAQSMLMIMTLVSGFADADRDEAAKNGVQCTPINPSELQHRRCQFLMRSILQMIRAKKEEDLSWQIT